jgi:HK97 family phage major capsid protein
MPYNNVTDATSVGNLIPEAVAGEIIGNLPQQSAALRLFRQVPMTTRTMRQNILSALPIAYFVNGDTGLKQTTEMEWGGLTLNVEEIAAILPVPINVIDDLEFDIWTEARPLIEEAVGRVIDAAVFFGVNKPASWPAAIVDGAKAAAGNAVQTVAADLSGAGWSANFVDRISDLMEAVEEDGYDPTGFVIPRGMRGRFRRLRDADGNRMADIANATYEGLPFVTAMDGQWPAPDGDQAPLMIAGDFTKGLIGRRKDITYEIFREGVVTDNTGAIIFNLMQQDMVAMRVTMRLAFQVANPINYSNLVAADRYPFSVMLAPDLP